MLYGPTYNSKDAKILPVYSDIMWYFEDASAIVYYDFDVSMNDMSGGLTTGGIKTFRIFNPTSNSVNNNKQLFNLSNILEDSFTSDCAEGLYLPLLKYSVKGYDYVAEGLDSSVWISDYYVFNGTDDLIYPETLTPDTYSGFNIENYIINVSTNDSKFLNNFDAERNIHYEAGDVNTRLSVATFKGVFNTSNEPSLNYINVFKYYADGSTVSTSKTLDEYAVTADPRIINIYVDPSTLGITLDENCVKYKIAIGDVRSEWVIINITPRDKRFNKYYRVMWTDRNGCNNYFNFDLIDSNTLDIDKTTFNSNGKLKQLNTTVDSIHTITTGWITEEESLALKDLWTSSNIKICTPPISYRFDPVILDVKKMKILKRQNQKTIQYQIDFMYTRSYSIQKN